MRKKMFGAAVILLLIFNLIPTAAFAEETGYKITATPLDVDISDGRAEFDVNIKISNPEDYERITVTAKPQTMENGKQSAEIKIDEPVSEWRKEEGVKPVDETYKKTLTGNLPSGKWKGELILEVEAIEIFSITYDFAGGMAPHGNSEAGRTDDGIPADNYPVTYTIEDEISIPDPIREGYNFTGWSCSMTPEAEPAADLVIPQGTTGDMTLTANWEIRHISEYTWSEIAEISEAGKADVLFAECFDMTKADLEDGEITDYCHTKDFEYDGAVYHAMIAGFDHDRTAVDTADDSQSVNETAGMSFVVYEPFADARMNDLDTNEGGWEASDMRTKTLVSLAENLPQELTGVIKEVQKSTAVVTQGVISMKTTVDKLWLLSETEAYGGSAGEGMQYSLFTQSDAETAARMLSTDTDYWLRSIAYNTDGFCMVDKQGELSYE